MRFTGINMNRVFATGVVWYLCRWLFTNCLSRRYRRARSCAMVEYSCRCCLFPSEPGTPEFQELFEQVTNDPDISTGSKFLDNTKSYVAEGNYNFSSLLDDKADIQVGGSYKQYSLNSSRNYFYRL